MDGRALTSRRRLLALGGATLTAAALAACGAAPAPTAKPAEKPPEKPAAPAPAPTTAPAAPPAPTIAPAAAPAKPTEAPAAAKPSTGAAAKAPVTTWQGQDYIEEVTGLMKGLFLEWGKQNGVEVIYEEKSGNWGDQLRASVQAGTPPDIHRVFDYEAQYWRGQNQSVDVSDVSGKLRSMEGGYYDYIGANASWQGKWYAVPFAVNAWPMHVRQDLLDAKGLKWPKDWDEFRKTAREVQKPPDLYAFGYNVARDADNNNHFLGMLWTFGGQLQDEQGKFAAQPNDKAWLETLKLTKAMFEEDKIVPPGAVTWDAGANNAGYQGGQLWATSNPTSIYTWLVKNNKPDLAKGTRFYPYPKGPAGEFGQVDVWSNMVFKASKAQDSAKAVLEYFVTPANYKKYVTDLKGRFLPVYKGLLDDPMWKSNPLYENYTTIAKNGRIMSHAGSPTAPVADIQTSYVIGDMCQDLLVKKQTPEQAYATFYTKAKAIYDKYPTL